MENVQERVGMPLDQFVREHDRHPFELINGEKKAKMPTIARHNETVHRIFLLLLAFVTERLLGLVRMESTFVLPDAYDTDWVKGSRTPDVLYISAARLEAYKAATPDWQDRPYTIVPDLVVEVVSPNDRYTEVDEKADQYLADGVRAVWILDPQRRKVRVYMRDGDLELRLKSDDRLDGGEILPGFSIALADLFSPM